MNPDSGGGHPYICDEVAAVAVKVLAIHTDDDGDGIVQGFCVHDGREWPCPTARVFGVAP